MSLTEMALSLDASQWRAFVDGQLARIDGIGGLGDADLSAVRSRFEGHAHAAEANALRLRGPREEGSHARTGNQPEALRRAGDRLVAAMQSDPPPTAREARQLMADVKLLEPDAYGTRSAVESVVLGDQRTRSATVEQLVEVEGYRRQRDIERDRGLPGPRQLDAETGQMVELSAEAEAHRRRREAGPHIGRRGGQQSGETSYENNSRWLRQAQAYHGHLRQHAPRPGSETYRGASTTAKNLERIARSARNADVPNAGAGGLGHLDAIAAAKSAENAPVATRDAIRGWAGESDVAAWATEHGHRLGTDHDQLVAFAQWAQSEGTRLVGVLQERTGTAAIFQDAPTGQATPPAATPTPSESSPVPTDDGGPTEAAAPSELAQRPPPLPAEATTNAPSRPPPPRTDDESAETRTRPRPTRSGDESVDTPSRPQPRRTGDESAEGRGRARPPRSGDESADIPTRRRPPDEDTTDPRADRERQQDDADQDVPIDPPDILDQMSSAPPEHLTFDFDAVQQLYDGHIAQNRHLEVSLIRNTETGQALVVQGNAERVSYSALMRAVRDLVRPELASRGRWAVLSHSHAADLDTGTTRQQDRAPSLADVHGVVHESDLSGTAAHEEIRITTERGQETLRVGFDPAAAQPIMVDLPRPDGTRERLTFPDIESYGEWYQLRFGLDPGPVPTGYSGPRRAAPAGRTSSGDIVDPHGTITRTEDSEQYTRQEFFEADRDPDPERPHNPRFHADARVTPDGTMTMDFSLRVESEGEMHRSGSIRGRAHFAEALAHFRRLLGADAVQRIRGSWGLGDNLEAFQGRYQQLLDIGASESDARLIAASETITGQWAAGVGFARIADVTIGDDGVTAHFAEGSSNVPAAPEPTAGSTPPLRRNAPDAGEDSPGETSAVDRSTDQTDAEATTLLGPTDRARTAERNEQSRAAAERSREVADSAQLRDRYRYTRRRLRSWRAEAVSDSTTPGGTIEMIDGLADRLVEIDAGIRDGSVDPRAISGLQADITLYRRLLRRGNRVRDRSRQRDGEVHLMLDDPETRAQVLEWFGEETNDLLGIPGGDYLRTRMLEQLAQIDEVVLRQSPRTAGEAVAGTSQMRRRVAEWMNANRYPPEYVRLFFDNMSRDGWPRTHDGRAWQVDHVLELWAGGEDGPANYLPLHPDLHAIKSEIWTRFRGRFRDQITEADEQVDIREHGGLPGVPVPTR